MRSVKIDMKLNDLDKRIVNLLVKDGRLSLRKVAKAAGVSPSTAMHHINELEKLGVLKGYSAHVDYDNAGLPIHVIVEMKIEKGKFTDVGKRLSHHRSVMAIYDHIGSFDATIMARFRDKRSLNSFLKEVQSYEFVERTETKLVLNTLKEEGIILT